MRAVIIFVALMTCALSACGSSSEKSVLDRLTREARAVNPPGTNEASLRRFPCGQQANDSASASYVLRTLTVRPGTAENVHDEIVKQYLGLGYHPNKLNRDDSALEGDTMVFVRVRQPGSSVEVEVSDQSTC